MIWIGVAVAVVVLLGVGAILLKRAHANPATGSVSGSDPSAGLSDADRVRRIAPAAPMVGLEAALDGVTDGQGRTLREQLDAGAPGVEQLRVDDDTSPILRRALDHVAPAASTEPTDEPIDEPIDEHGGEPIDEHGDEPIDEHGGEPIDEHGDVHGDVHGDDGTDDIASSGP